MKKQILIIIGVISLGLGIVGIFLPLLPTTPFLLLSSFCFSKSSERLHKFIINNKIFGQYIRDYQEKKGITLKNKIFVLTFLTLGISYSMYKTSNSYVQIFLVIILIFVSLHIIKLKTIK